MKKVKVMILRTAGTNCDKETAFAFQKVGGSCELVHINKVLSSKKMLAKFQILAIPGGFTYGDDIASGKVLANEIMCKLKENIIKFIKDGKLIIGICNGFQVLVKSGLLPNTTGGFDTVEATLGINNSGKFEDRWIYLKTHTSKNIKQKCVWTRGLEPVIYLPVAHAEGKFIPKNKKLLDELEKNGQIVITYCDKTGEKSGYPWNPNGSQRDIAGICDKTGKIFGLMPHPERHMFFTQHPHWTREKSKKADGLEIFKNGIKAARDLV
ncbi:MAG: phosphoribosylformylglycinamidine synthase I [Candidatus Omnitrophota bacterium]